MAVSLITRLGAAFRRLEHNVLTVLCGGIAPDVCCVVVEAESRPRKESFNIEDLVGDGFLWAVPKSRRTIEKRLKRKFGSPDYVMKLLLPKTTLRACNVCGDDHEVGVLCPTCYKKIIEETKTMQDKIEGQLGLNPVEKEVVVLYDGEKENKPREFFEGKRIVEMEKPRPAWFSKNLLQETTQKESNSTDISIKPTDLS